MLRNQHDVLQVYMYTYLCNEFFIFRGSEPNRHYFSRMPPRRRVGRPQRAPVAESVNYGEGTHRNDKPQPPPLPPPPPPERRIEELFLRQNPPVFNSVGDPTEAETWVRAVECIFNFLHCTDQERLTCMSFQLSGSADFW